MTIGQGTIFTSSDVKSQLREANRNYQGFNPWSQAYASISLSEREGIDRLTGQYRDAMNQAYISSLQQKHAILNSNMGQGFRNAALDENKSILDDAFESYRNSYLSGVNEVKSSADSARTEIDSLLSSYAKNMSAFGNAHFNYLGWLYKKNPDAFGLDTEKFVNNPNKLGLSMYLKSDESGELVPKTLGEFTSLVFDEDGNLTEEGARIFEEIETGNYISAGQRFGDYLAEVNPELYDWAVSADPYNFTKNGTAAGTFYEPIRSVLNNESAKSLLANDYDSYAFNQKAGKLYKTTTNNDSYTTTKHSDYSEIETYAEGERSNVRRAEKNALDTLKTMYESGKLSESDYGSIYQYLTQYYNSIIKRIDKDLSDFKDSHKTEDELAAERQLTRSKRTFSGS